MGTVFDVAKYILKKLGSTTTMKLQKMAYYCQAWSLAWDGVPLFDEEFEAWANGPVCPALFKKFKGSFIVEDSAFADQPDCDFSPEQIETMDEVIKYYGDKESHWLSELTHLELPWRVARGKVPAGEPCSTVVSKESMQEYYGGLQ